MHSRILSALPNPTALAVEYVEKTWGKTACVSKHPGFTVHHLVVLPGKRCSRHYHMNRINGFFVISGHMAVREFDENWKSVNVIELPAGSYYEVPHGVRHRFETPVSGCEALEIYLPPNVREDDIIRFDVGGELED